MKICLIHHVADLYGSSRSLLRLASALIAEGHSVHVFLQEDGPLRVALDDASVSVAIMPVLPVMHRQRMRSPWAIAGLIRDWLLARKMLSAWLSEEKPDIVHSNSATLLPVAGCCAFAQGIPHIQHVREFFSEFGFLWTVYRSLLMRYASLVVCVSHAVARQFPAREQIRVLHNGFPAAEFPDLNESTTGRGWRQQFVDDGGVLIGVIGRIKLKRKGQETFVDAAARLGKRFNNAHFVIVGSPFPGNEDQRQLIIDQIHSSGMVNRIHLVDEVDTPRIVYEALDIVVMPSGMPEPFGGVVIEAMACGKAVVGTAMGGTSEQIDDGVTGLLVPPNDPQSMADAIGRLIEHPAMRRNMGIAGRKRFLAKFEFSPFFSQLMKLYQIVQETRES